MVARTLAGLNKAIIECHACPRLTNWRERVAIEKRKAFSGEEYWGKPIPSFGSESPHTMLVGLAPAAHGGNRTGRVFTGDRSGDFLFAALHKVGFASQPTSTGRDDGMELYGARLLAAVRCAPPANKPTPEEEKQCRPWLVKEFELTQKSVRSYVAFGAFAWQAVWRALSEINELVAAHSKVKFSHGVRVDFPTFSLFGTFHPSQQNTFTGKLTPRMLEMVLADAMSNAQKR